jgi:hypothetical protein
MATAEDILKDAYERYGIKDAETALTTQEKTDGISIINDTMLQLGIESTRSRDSNKPGSCRGLKSF